MKDEKCNSLLVEEATAQRYVIVSSTAERLHYYAGIRLESQTLHGPTGGTVKYEFGNVRVDASARTASVSGLPVHLTRKALDLLLLLLECPQTVVSKDQIYGRLWPDTFVTESGLQTLVYEIRHAIDDHRSGRSWIRTVRGIGYSFAGHVVVDGVPTERPPTYPAAWLTNAATSFPLYMGENVIGRAPDNPLDVQHPTISRRHACIAIGESITLEDLGSKNGTWLDDERVTARRVLDDGAVVSFVHRSGSLHRNAFEHRAR